MIPIRRLLPLAAALAAAVVPAALAAQHAPAHAHAPAAGASPAHGARWTAGADLHAGMSRIRAAVDELRHHEMGHMGDARAARAAALADGIGRDIAWIVAHCTLEPAADAALHPVIGMLAASAAALKAHPDDLAAIARMREASAAYARLFDDPAATGEPIPVDEPEERRD